MKTKLITSANDGQKIILKQSDNFPSAEIHREFTLEVGSLLAEHGADVNFVEFDLPKYIDWLGENKDDRIARAEWAQEQLNDI